MDASLTRLAAAGFAAVLVAACGKSEDPHAIGTPSAPRAEAPRSADADGDGRVTRKEAARDPKLAAAFDRHDRNSDGALDRGEFARLEAEPSRAPAAEDDSEGAPLRPREEYPQPAR